MFDLVERGRETRRRERERGGEVDREREMTKEGWKIRGIRRGRVKSQEKRQDTRQRMTKLSIQRVKQ